MAAMVTVIVPVYNGEKYLAEAIQSVRNQSVSQWKMVIVDDLSSDGSCQLAEEYSRLDDRIQFYKNDKNLGLYGTLDKWIHTVDTEWTVILMQDDVLREDHFEKFLSIARSYPDASLYWGGEDLIDENGVVFSKGMETEQVEVIEPSLNAWKSVIKRGCIWTISGSFSSSRYLKSVGFRSDLRHAADYLLILESVRRVKSVYVKDALVKIRIHKGQTTNHNAKSASDIRDYVVIMREQIDRYGSDLSLGEKIIFKAQKRCGALRRVIRCLVDNNFKCALTAARLAVFFR